VPELVQMLREGTCKSSQQESEHVSSVWAIRQSFQQSASANTHHTFELWCRATKNLSAIGVKSKWSFSHDRANTVMVTLGRCYRQTSQLFTFCPHSRTNPTSRRILHWSCSRGFPSSTLTDGHPVRL